MPHSCWSAHGSYLFRLPLSLALDVKVFLHRKLVIHWTRFFLQQKDTVIKKMDAAINYSPLRILGPWLLFCYFDFNAVWVADPKLFRYPAFNYKASSSSKNITFIYIILLVYPAIMFLCETSCIYCPNLYIFFTVLKNNWTENARSLCNACWVLVTKIPQLDFPRHINKLVILPAPT